MYIKNDNQEGSVPSSPQIADHVLHLMLQDLIKPLGETGLLDKDRQESLLLIKQAVIALSQKAHAYEKIYQSENASHIRN